MTHNGFAPNGYKYNEIYTIIPEKVYNVQNVVHSDKEMANE